MAQWRGNFRPSFRSDGQSVDAKSARTSSNGPEDDEDITLYRSHSGQDKSSGAPSSRYGDQGLSINDFEVLSKIGEGGFGTVLLVRKKSTGKLYALKVLVKRNMRRSGDARRAISESAAMQEIKHPFVVTLHFAFQDANHIYFVLEFVGGGDLYSHLERQTFPEEWAQVYIAEIALAIAHVHSHDFVYRDLKPENILVAHDGHLKLADFGLAKKLHSSKEKEAKEEEGGKRDRLNTMIGTMAFSAPEMFIEKDYGKSVDWWALGLLLCEMVTGDLPLVGLNDDNMTARVESFKTGKHLKPLPRSLSKAAADLIKRLLTVSTKKRMCCGPEGFEELKKHAFFAGLDWDRLYRREIDAPLKPLLGPGGTAAGDEASSRYNNRIVEREADMLEEEFGLYVGEDDTEVASRYAASAALCEAAAHSDFTQLEQLISGGTDVNQGDYDKRTALHLAASEGLSDVVLWLIDTANADPSPVDRWGGTPLDDAIRSKHTDVVETLNARGAKKGAPMKARVSSNAGASAPSSEVCDAAANGDMEALRLLLKEGVDMNAGDYDKRTAIHLAASEGLVHVLRFLVEVAKVHVNPVDRWGGTPLDDAARSKHEDAEHYLRDHGAKRGEKAELKADPTADLIEAASKGDLERLRALLATGVDVNLGDYDRRTALHLAASEGLKKVTEFLIDEGHAGVNPVDRWGGTPLDDAIRSKHKDVATYLVAKGGYTAKKLLTESQTKDHGMNMCDAAAQGNVMAIRVLIAQGADVNVGDYDKRTALHLAASEGMLDMVRLLVREARADVNVKDRWGGTPLDDAMRHKHQEVTDYLQRNGAERGTRQDATIGDLCDAAAKGDVKSMRDFVKQGVDPNAGDYDNRTPLHLAASEGILHVVTFLVEEAMADASPVDRWGGTPLDDAARHGHVSVSSYLLAKGGVAGKRSQSVLEQVLAADDETAAETTQGAGAGAGAAAAAAATGRTTCGSAAGGGVAAAPSAAAPGGGGDGGGALHVTIAGEGSGGKRSKVPAPTPVAPGPLRVEAHAALLCSLAASGRLALLRDLLSKEGFSADARNADKRSPLHVAAAWGQLEVAQFLVDEMKVDTAALDRAGRTALDEAVRERHAAVAEMLRARGALATFENTAQAHADAAVNALCVAAARGEVERIEELLKRHGNGLAAKANYDRRTPLHLAAAEGRSAAVRLLLGDLKVDPSPVDRWGGTPLDDALRHGHEEIAANLRAAGGARGAGPKSPCACTVS